MPERRITVQQKRDVVARARGYCEYCRSQERFAMQRFSVEHIVPLSLGGMTTLDNLALACQGCNNHKYTKTEGHDPISGDIESLYHPRRQRWGEHFAWDEDCNFIIGLTSIGRTTVETLCLNREGLVNMRRVLYVMGMHPPPDT